MLEPKQRTRVRNAGKAVGRTMAPAAQGPFSYARYCTPSVCSLLAHPAENHLMTSQPAGMLFPATTSRKGGGFVRADIVRPGSRADILQRRCRRAVFDVPYLRRQQQPARHGFGRHRRMPEASHVRASTASCKARQTKRSRGCGGLNVLINKEGSLLEAPFLAFGAFSRHERMLRSTMTSAESVSWTIRPSSP